MIGDAGAGRWDEKGTDLGRGEGGGTTIVMQRPESSRRGKCIKKRWYGRRR